MICRSTIRLFFIATALAILSTISQRVALADKPNVLFIAIDDQNDWIGCLNGHAAAKTPNIDRLAKEGVLFSNAHCQAPLCNPSRTSVLLGLRPSTTGVYGLAPWFRDVASLRDRVTLPQHFKNHGYKTMTVGKIFHGPPAGADRAKEFDVWGPGGGIGVTPKQKLIPATPMGNHPLMDWGAFPHRVEEKGDYQIASWAVSQIKEYKDDQPFFLSVGFFLPHVPLYVTPEQLDAIPNDRSLLPEILESDRNDVPRFSWYLHWELPEPRLGWVRDNDQWLPLVRSYLASTAMIDDQIGRLMEALRETGHSKDTIVVLWSDHGYHLGEKGITGKNSLWERSTHVPLIFSGPGVKSDEGKSNDIRNSTCDTPVELLDIYPTLIDLCGLSPRNDLEGRSLVSLCRSSSENDDAKKERVAITTHNQGNHTIRSSDWRYIRYADGSEELYDMKNDPQEWANLALSVGHQQQKEILRKYLPSINAQPVAGSAQRILTYDGVRDEAIWEGKVVTRDTKIPQ